MISKYFLSMVFALCLVGSLVAQAESHRETEFIGNHPYDDNRGWQLSSGTFVRAPFRIYEADMSVILGLADLDQVKKLAQNSNYQPTVMIKDGKSYAVVRLYFVDYKDTDAGPYREFILAFDSHETAMTLPYVNPYSLALPFSVPGYRVFLDELTLNRKAPIDLGVEAWGLNKKKGSLKIQSRRSGAIVTKQVRIKDNAGRKIVSGAFEIDQSPEAVENLLVGLKEALAAIGVNEIPPPPKEYSVGQVNLHVKTGQTSLQDDFLSWQASIHPYKGNLQINESSQLGKKISRLNFIPLLMMNSENAQFTVDNPNSK